MPAAARLAPSVPAVDAICPPVPVSISTSFAPVLTSRVVNGVESLSAGMRASASALCTSGKETLRTNLSSTARCQTPSLSAVSSKLPSRKR